MLVQPEEETTEKSRHALQVHYACRVTILQSYVENNTWELTSITCYHVGRSKLTANHGLHALSWSYQELCSGLHHRGSWTTLA
jgi:hypothetical protein